jgi:hypothetical protein
MRNLASFELHTCSDHAETNSYIGGAIFIPPAEYPAVINSYLPVPRQVTIWQSGVDAERNRQPRVERQLVWGLVSEGTPQFGSLQRSCGERNDGARRVFDGDGKQPED